MASALDEEKHFFRQMKALVIPRIRQQYDENYGRHIMVDAQNLVLEIAEALMNLRINFIA